MRHRPLIRYFVYAMTLAAVVAACDSVSSGPGSAINIQDFIWQDTEATMPADGTSELPLTVTAITADGSRVQNVTVEFTTTAGTLVQARVLTDANGTAETDLVSAASTTDVLATVDATVIDTTGYILNPKTNALIQVDPAPEGTLALVSAGPMTDEEIDARVHAILLERAQQAARERQRGMQGLLGEPIGGEAADAEKTEATELTVRMEGIVLTVTTDTNPLTADGSSSAQIQARVRTTSGKGLSGRQIDFTAVYGNITPAVNTNQFGIATATLGSVLTTALADTVLVELNPQISSTLIQPYVQPVLTLTADDASLPSNGTATTTVRARLLSPTGTPVVGARVVFSASGVADASLTPLNAGLTNNTGEASATLKSGVTAGSVAIQATFSSLVSNATVDIRDLNLTVTSTNASIVANGSNSTTVQVLVTETTTNRAVPNAQIYWSVAPNGIGTITPTSTTNNLGVASGTLVSGTNAGPATVTATQGPRSANTVVTMLPRDLVIAVQPAATSLIRDSIAKTDVTVSVQDPSGTLLNNVQVSWATSAGAIFPTSGQTGSTGNSNGTHRATLTADASAADATATITVTVEAGAVDSVRTSNVALKGITITSSASLDTILANGSDSATLTWQLQETTSGAGIGGHSISISKVSGPSVTTSAFPTLTGPSGTATVTVSGSSGGSLVMQAAVAGISQQQGLELLSDQFQVSLSSSDGYLIRDGQDQATLTIEVLDRFFDPVQGAQVTLSLVGQGSVTRPSATGATGRTTAILRSDVNTATGNAQLIATAGGVSDTLDVPLYGVAISVSADPTTLVADGVEQVTLTATVRAASTGILLPGQTVYFSFNPADSLDFSSGSAVTGADGQARVTVSSNAVSAIAGTVTARVGSDPASTLTATTPLSVQPQVLTLDFSAGIGLRLNRNALDELVLTVEVRDAVVDKAIANETVTWSKVGATPAGVTLSGATSKTNTIGIATVVVTGDANTADALGTIKATVAASADSVDIDLVGLTLTASASPDTLSANGVVTTTVTAVLKETTDNVPVSGGILAFATDLGTIGGSGTTDGNGIVTSTFTAGTTAGTASVDVTYGGLSAATMVELIAGSPTSIIMEASQQDLYVLGTGVSPVTSIITATVYDQFGNTVPNQAVTLVATPDGTFSNGSQTNGALTNDDGEATFVFTSGTTSGTKLITATAGAAQSDIALIRVAAGPADSIDMGDPSSGTATEVAPGLSQMAFGVAVKDAQTNPVAQGTLVYFAVTGGSALVTITTADPLADGTVAATDVNGLASTVLTYPSTEAGNSVTITVTIETALGTVTNSITFNLPAP